MKSTLIICRKTIYTLLLILCVAFIPAQQGCTKAKQDGEARQKMTYYCPMHPEVTAEKPGVCPICHMDLVIRSAGSSTAAVNEQNSVMAGGKTITVAKQKIIRSIKSYAVLEIPEENRKIISARFNGRIEKLFAARTGDVIKKGDALFTAYSPDIYRAASELLVAAAAYQKDNSPQNLSVYESVKKRLELSGVPQGYIESAEKSKRAEYTFSYPSPYSGIILQKKANEGAYFSEGSELYEIVSLSSLWAVADVYEQDAAQLKTGCSVRIAFSALPGFSAEGKVTFISPVVDKQKRTVQVRAELQNTSGKLKPQMYGEASFSIDAGMGILVPQEAIQFTGRNSFVWIKAAGG